MKRALLCLLLVVAGCITTTTPDGTTTRQTDIAATIAVMESTLALLEQGYAMYLEQLERADGIEAQRLEQRAAAQQERIRLVQDALMALYCQQVAE